VRLNISNKGQDENCRDAINYKQGLDGFNGVLRALSPMPLDLVPHADIFPAHAPKYSSELLHGPSGVATRLVARSHLLDRLMLAMMRERRTSATSQVVRRDSRRVLG
jgi:hypothetical protein